MNEIVLFKNKGEIIKCHFDIEGAKTSDAVVRLCLEFEDNKNMFFYGSLEESGDCTIPIPKLKEFENKKGKLTIEAIIDGSYFQLYQQPIELKNSVEVKMSPISQTSKPKVAKTSIKLESLVAAPKESKLEKIIEQDENNLPEQKDSNPYIPKVKQNGSKKSNFEDWFNNKYSKN